MRWQAKLTQKQRQHLKECNATTLQDVKANVMYQATNRFPCWECVDIGRRLGIEVELVEFNKGESKDWRNK